MRPQTLGAPGLEAGLRKLSGPRGPQCQRGVPRVSRGVLFEVSRGPKGCQKITEETPPVASNSGGPKGAHLKMGFRCEFALENGISL